jgi:hypothetical protein
MRTRRYIGIIVSLLLLAAILLLFTDPWSTLRRESRRIVLRDHAGIDRIVLADRYDTSLLVRQDTTWLIAGEEPANRVAVENLLFAAERLQISSVYSGLGDRKIEPYRSVSFCKGDRTVLQYDIAARGDHMLLRPGGGEQLFLVSLPGYAGLDLDRVFSSAADHYREHLLIDLMPSDILHVEVERRGERPFRFTMDEDGTVHCALRDPDSTLSPGLLDDLSIRLLFSYFTSIRYEEKAGSASGAMAAGMDQGRWLARLCVESRQGEKHTLQVFSLPAGNGEGADMFRALVIHNNDPDALVVKYIYLDVLMRGLAHYFAEEG